MCEAYIFPGQGTQKRGMGADVFAQFPSLLLKADNLLGYSIEELCLNDKRNILNDTQYAQPALYIVNVFTYLSRIKKTKSIPNYVAGHSLGEYVALFAAGVYNFEAGLRLVMERGSVMAKAKAGGMAAIVGLDARKVAEIFRENNMSSLDIANHNSKLQIVISGPLKDINEAEDIFVAAGGSYVPLQVSGAFHSRYMEQAKEEFRKVVEKISFKSPKIPVIANLDAKPYAKEKIAHNLIQQITNPVRWTDSILYLINQGVKNFVEIGAGNVLSGLVKRIKKENKSI